MISARETAAPDGSRSLLNQTPAGQERANVKNKKTCLESPAGG
jgi:hypothetical protein